MSNFTLERPLKRVKREWRFMKGFTQGEALSKMNYWNYCIGPNVILTAWNKSQKMKISFKSFHGQTYTCKAVEKDNKWRFMNGFTQGWKPFACSKCDKSFTDNVTYAKWSIENTWKYPHRRKAICLFKHLSHFIQSIALKNQDRIHWREKPLACSKCNKSFTENGRLKTHDNGAKHVYWVNWNRSHFFQWNRSQS